MTDSITRSIVLKAPMARVWRALIDPGEFGLWFGVSLDRPFVVGQETTGRMVIASHAGWPWWSRTVTIEPPHRLVFVWSHVETATEDASRAPTTQVEITLEPARDGTRLTVLETGFAALPASRRAGIIRGNEQGWEIQLGNIRAHVER